MIPIVPLAVAAGLFVVGKNLYRHIQEANQENADDVQAEQAENHDVTDTSVEVKFAEVQSEDKAENPVGEAVEADVESQSPEDKLKRIAAILQENKPQDGQ